MTRSTCDCTGGDTLIVDTNEDSELDDDKINSTSGGTGVYKGEGPWQGVAACVVVAQVFALPGVCTGEAYSRQLGERHVVCDGAEVRPADGIAQV